MKYIITESQLKKLTSLISETSEEEAWELVGQDHEVIKSVVSKKDMIMMNHLLRS